MILHFFVNFAASCEISADYCMAILPHVSCHNMRLRLTKQGVCRGIQLIKTDNKHNIDRYPGKSYDSWMAWKKFDGLPAGKPRATA
jgi:hypothetical protein